MGLRVLWGTRGSLLLLLAFIWRRRQAPPMMGPSPATTLGVHSARSCPHGRHVPIVPLQPSELRLGALTSPNPAPAANPA